jgi:hypothetical protein
VAAWDVGVAKQAINPAATIVIVRNSFFFLIIGASIDF